MLDACVEVMFIWIHIDITSLLRAIMTTTPTVYAALHTQHERKKFVFSELQIPITSAQDQSTEADLYHVKANTPEDLTRTDGVYIRQKTILSLLALKAILQLQ